MTTTNALITLEAFLTLPEEKPALEYENGVVTQKVSPKGRHSALQVGITDQINKQIRPGKLGKAFTELRATYETLSRVPDIAIYRWGRIPRDEAGDILDDFFNPPDIAIEIISPGQTVNRMIRRCLTFVRAGVQAAILVDPTDRSVAVMRPDAAIVVLRPGDVLVLSDIIAGLRLDITAIFDELRG